jgi:acetone carboxylase gamma subunit
MIHVLEHVARHDDGDESRFECLRCGASLGIGGDLHELAGVYDADINSLEPEQLHTQSTAAVLRHYGCPHCGVLFEIEVVLRDGD